MKYIGFIKEYNNIKEAMALSDLTSTLHMPIRNDHSNIISYLNEGILLLAWMGYFVDVEENELIAPDTYFTDGIWVWPAYFPYYLSKFPTMKLSHAFLDNVRTRNYQLGYTPDLLINKPKWEKELALKLSNGRECGS